MKNANKIGIKKSAASLIPVNTTTNAATPTNARTAERELFS